MDLSIDKTFQNKYTIAEILKLCFEQTFLFPFSWLQPNENGFMYENENRAKKGPYDYLVPKIFGSKRFGVKKYFQAQSSNFDGFSNKSSLTGAWSFKKKTHYCP